MVSDPLIQGVSACLIFIETDNVDWVYGVVTTIFDALLIHCPVNPISTLTAQTANIQLSMRVALAERARLVPATSTFKALGKC